MPLRRSLLAGLVALATPAGAAAHYHMLLPNSPSAKAGEAVTLTYQFGHPFEHQLFDAAPPKHLFVLAPDGTRTDLAGTLEKIAVGGADGKKVAAFRAVFTPAKRGDHTVVAVAAPVTAEGEALPLHDLVKVVVHVQTQNGWDRAAGVAGFPEPLPLTRPYGLVPGVAFRAGFEDAGQPVAGALVEVERYNPAPPKHLPPDEHITRAARTDRVGTATVTPTEPGWWSVTAVRDQNGERRRGTLWFFVDEK